VKRLKIAAPILILYWLMLVGGLGMYAALRADDETLRSLWVGALGGTLLGHMLALRDVRGVVAMIFVFLTACWLAAVLPSEIISRRLWMAFAPAALCAFLSLGDRASLAAFWFPAVIWMLSVLDRTGPHATPDRSGMVLLGLLAILFFVFLRARESRRIRLWQNVAVVPLAAELPAKVLREAPGWHLARAGWTVLVGGVAAMVTAFVAPRLWQGETFDGEHVTIVRPLSASGRPCCPVSYDLPSDRGRVKEYFDMGRGRDELQQPQIEGIDCDACNGEPASSTYESSTYVGPIVQVPSGPYVATGEPVYQDRPYAGDSTYTPGVGEVAPIAPHIAPSVPEPSAPGYRPDPTMATPQPQVAQPPAPSAPAPVMPQLPTPAPAQPPAVPHETPTAPAAPAVSGPSPSPSEAPPPPSLGSADRQPDSRMEPSLVRWIAVLVACVLLLQVIALALRPLRRWFLLRHLRRPFWAETVDQRVSNSWQLALVGLRDAGWVPSSDEAPRELARRVGIDGLEKCATILERARHGLGIDAEDLVEMNRSADVAYASARDKLGGAARAASWLRWPLA
jgi:hypothetical protein